MTVIYYITLIVICFMIYDLAYNRKEGFQHRGGEIRPTQTPVSEDTTKDTSIAENTIYATYIVSETMAKEIIIGPYNYMRSIINLLTTSLENFLDSIMGISDRVNSLITPLWRVTKKVYYKLIGLLKDMNKSIMDMLDE